MAVTSTTIADAIVETTCLTFAAIACALLGRGHADVCAPIRTGRDSRMPGSAMTRVGFTGTQIGMRPGQEMAVYGLVLRLGVTDLSHGDCIGADDQMDQIACELGLTVYIHPPSNPSKRAWCKHRPHGELWVASMKPYIERNHEIVDATKGLIAAPKEMTETLRSGTWSTIRYARSLKRPIYIVWPDGSLATENTRMRND